MSEGEAQRRPLLSPGQREVVLLVALGLTTGQVAERLHYSQHTVKTVLRRASAKLGGTQTRTETVVGWLLLDSTHDERLRLRRELEDAR